MPKTREVYQRAHRADVRAARQQDLEGQAGAPNAMRIETALAKVQQDEVARRDPHKVYHRVDRDGLEEGRARFPWGDYLAALGIPDVTAISVNDPAYYTAIAAMLEDREAGRAARLPDAGRAARAAPRARQGVGRRGLHDAARSFAASRSCRRAGAAACNASTATSASCSASRTSRRGSRGDSKARAVDLTKAVLGAMRGELDHLPWMDDADPRRREGQARQDGVPGRLSRHVAQVRLRDHAQRLRRERPAPRRAWSSQRQLAQDRQAGRPARLADDAADGERVLRPDAQRDRAARRPAPAAVLRRDVPPRGQLRLDRRRHDRPRDDPRLRRRGQPVRRRRQPPRLVERRRPRSSSRTRPSAWSISTRSTRPSRASSSTASSPRARTSPTTAASSSRTRPTRRGARRQERRRAAVEGYTDDQLYFLAYAQSWCEKVTPELLETMAHSNPHRPPMWRVNGVIVNQPGFGAAFRARRARR